MKTLVESAKAAKAASLEVAQLGTERKNEALRAMAKALVEKTPEILAANEKDMTKGRESGMPESLLDRLMLNADRIAGMAEGLDQVAALPDPIGRVMDEWTRPNGLVIPQGPRADGRHRHHLRGEAERHGGRRGAGLQGRQRNAPARQLLGV